MNYTYKNTNEFITKNSIHNEYMVFILDDIKDMNIAYEEIQKHIINNKGITYNSVCNIINKNVKYKRYKSDSIEGSKYGWKNHSDIITEIKKYGDIFNIYQSFYKPCILLPNKLIKIK